MGEINYEYLYDGGHNNPDAPDVITYEMLLDGTAQITAEEFDSLYYKDSTNNKKCELIKGCMSNFSAGAFGNIVGKPITFGYQSYLDYVDTYKVHRDNLDVTYKLADGEITIAQAIENAETYYNSIFPLFTSKTIPQNIKKKKLFTNIKSACIIKLFLYSTADKMLHFIFIFKNLSKFLAPVSIYFFNSFLI
mgnify:CR=1 FL=1